jgi:aminoglycoside phosphotransferase (APT) family kinase protein
MTPADTAPVRPGEELPRESLAGWLSTRLPGGSSVEVAQFPGGHSNLTYLVRAGVGEYVLRRPPLGPVAATAHDMVREARVLQAVHPHYPLAPRVFAVCEDATVIGAPFFVMERRHGVVIRSGLPAAWAGLADATDRISRGLIDGLADLHRIDVQAAGLAALGRPEGFLDRQVRGWSERWGQAQTEAVDSMAPVIAWLGAHRPESAATTIVHHDYKLDNVMLDPADPGRLVAVLDWEMATIGDPLADLGLTLTYWTLPEARRVAGMDQAEGWWTRDALVERYATRTGVDVAPLPWYEVLGIFKLGVIVQQIYARFVRGQTQDPRFRDMGRLAAALAARAAERIR